MNTVIELTLLVEELSWLDDPLVDGISLTHFLETLHFVATSTSTVGEGNSLFIPPVGVETSFNGDFSKLSDELCAKVFLEGVDFWAFVHISLETGDLVSGLKLLIYHYNK